MTFISYAQNYEDVLLWRALNHVKNGRYLDIGAQDPVLDSVSKSFHMAGWNGIHVEPTPAFAEALKADRPGDTIIQAAIGENGGSIYFYEFPETGLSTGVEEIARRHAERGFSVREIQVQVRSLDELLDEIGAGDIHWMKIDVEGMEPSVLRSWGSNPTRPWIVVVESTLPLTQAPTHGEWKDLLLSRDYHEVYFDGLSRYFVSDAHRGLDEAFALPPNVFDGFSVAVRHFSAHTILEEQQAAMDTLRANCSAAIQSSNELRIEAEGAQKLLRTQLHEEQERGREFGHTIGILEAAKAELQRLAETYREAELAASKDREEALTALHQQVGKFDQLRAERAAVDDALRAEQAKCAKLESEIAVLNRDAALCHELISRALATPTGRWQRLGQALGVMGNDPVKQVLLHRTTSISPQTTSLEPMTNCPADWHEANPYHRANSLDELLSWHDVDFVRCAYVTILGRQPDPDGETFYVRRLRRGHSKLELLWQLRRSAEAKCHDPGIAGLDRALKKAVWERKFVVGTVVRLITGGEGDRVGDRRHRSLFNEIGRLRADQANFFSSHELASSICSGISVGNEHVTASCDSSQSDLLNCRAYIEAGPRTQRTFRKLITPQK